MTLTATGPFRDRWWIMLELHFHGNGVDDAGERNKIKGGGALNDLMDDRKQGHLVKIKEKKTVRQTLTISFIPPQTSTLKVCSH